MQLLITGAAGFIGFHLCKRMLEDGHTVIGIDNINDQYSINLKFDRLNELGINKEDAEIEDIICHSNIYTNFKFYRIDLTQKNILSKVFSEHKFDKVCHLAARGGVRNSIENTIPYIQSNIVGFDCLLEEVSNRNISHLVYASSSSVYGESSEVPFKTSQIVDKPISMYAATKKSNELMAHVYSHLYGFSATGLRFFTVYGPWGRPDMAYYLFTKAIIDGDPIKVFNKGQMLRDFTYIDDIVQGIVLILESDENINSSYRIYNIGNNKAETLEDFIATIEKHLEKKALKVMLPIQKGDVTKTFADIDNLVDDYGYAPKVSIFEGLKKFVDWYNSYNDDKTNCKSAPTKRG